MPYIHVFTEVERDLLTSSCQRAQQKAAASPDFAIYDSSLGEAEALE